jgi:peptidyl-prolyl cis-trans isomerase A (cyclophilin A)
MLSRLFALFVVPLALAAGNVHAAGDAAAAGATPAHPQVELDTTLGRIRVELYPEAAAKTVANFLEYVKSGFYDGTQFHRVINGFMVQGGGFTSDFTQKPTRAPVPIESQQSKGAGLSNVPGTLAMARTRDPDSATAQFFINVADNARLDFRSADVAGYGYTVFGKVVDGMDVVNRIAGVAKGGRKVPPGAPMDPADVPTEPVVIQSARVVKAGS